MPLRKEAPTPRSAAVARRSSQAAVHDSSGPLIPFKAGETSLRRQAILTENEYTASLSRIIKRDFFPKLDRLKAENSYLTALEQGDAVQTRRALNTLLRIDELESGGPSAHATAANTSSVHNSGGISSFPDTPTARKHGEWENTPLISSPHDVATPAASHSALQLFEEDIPSGINPDLTLSATEFQARYTSEDNASFDQLLQLDNEVRAHKYASTYSAELHAKQRRAELVHKEQQEALAGKQLSLKAAEERGLRIKEKAPLLLLEPLKGALPEDMSSTGSLNNETVEELLLIDPPRQDDRPENSGLGRWKYTARNALTFGPQVRKIKVHSSGSDTSRPGPRINLHNTDFEEYDEAAESEDPGSPTSTRIDAAIERGPVSTTTLGSRSAFADDTPKVNGYSFVSPSSTPAHGTTHEDENLLRLFNRKSQHEPDSAELRQFSLPADSKRDRLAARLGSSTPHGNVKGSADAVSSPYGTQKYHLPSRTLQTRQKQQLTPAAQALLDRTGKYTPRTTLGHTLLSRNKAADQLHSSIQKRVRDETLAMDSLKRQRWTPSPSPVPHHNTGL